MPEEKKQVYEFGPFRLDPSKRLLWLNGQLEALEPKAIKTLVVLVRAKGDLVEMEELIQQVWEDTFVTNDSVHRNVRMLRKRLAQEFNGQECIQNIPKRGYRFLLPVKESRLTDVSTPLGSELEEYPTANTTAAQKETPVDPAKYDSGLA